MNYNNNFNTLIDICIEQNQYLGLGNPNAKILFVGKEAGSPTDSDITHGSGLSWKENKNDYSRRFTPDEKNENKLRNKNHTWQKYQRLYESILDRLNIKEESIKKDYEISFVENVFTTELSNLPALKTSEAKKLKDFKPNLENRKTVFWKSDFIKQFPIIIIAASDNKYIETYNGEVCELFDVEFSETLLIGNSGKIWVHYAEEGKNNIFPKLVIHTRQLTNGASNNLLAKIADFVKDFVEKYDIKIN